MPQDVDRSLEIAFTCPLPSGIHARPASYLADCANTFVSEITLTNRRSGVPANAKSVLAIIAADIRYEDECTLRVQGSDEQAALNAMRRFIEEQDGILFNGRAKSGDDVFRRFADPHRLRLGIIDHEELPAERVGDRLGADRLAGSRRPGKVKG